MSEEWTTEIKKRGNQGENPEGWETNLSTKLQPPPSGPLGPGRKQQELPVNHDGGGLSTP